MTNASDKKRTDTASKVITASPQTIYQSFMDPKALISWLPPEGMNRSTLENLATYLQNPKVNPSF